MSHFVKKSLRLLIVFCFLFSLLGTPAMATEQDSLFKSTNESTQVSEYKQQMSSGEVIWMLVKVVLALLLICVLIYFLVKFLARRSQPFSSPRSLRIVAGIGLAPQKTIQIVEIGQKIYIIGVGQEIRVLDKLEDPAEIAVLLDGLEHTSIFNETLVNSWKSSIQGWFKKKEAQSEELTAEEYEKMFSEQLQEANQRQNTVEQWMEENKERSNES